MPLHLGRHGGEAETLVGQAAEAGHMLADRDFGAEQLGVNRPRADAHVVDVVAVDPDQRRAIARPASRPLRRSGTDARRNSHRVRQWRSQPVWTSTALPRTSRPSNASASIAMPFSHGRRTTMPGKSASDGKRQVGEVGALGIAMERRIEIGAGIRDHVDPADLEGRSVVVIGGRAFALPEIADVRAGQALVGRHALLDHMAEVDDPLFLNDPP